MQVWKWTLDYVKERPFGGGFDAYLGNSFTYETRKAVGEGNTQTIEYNQVTDKGRAYHSAYFEMLGEQGWPGCSCGCGCTGSGCGRWSGSAGALRKQEDGRKSWQWGLATALQQAQIVYLVGSLFVGIAFQPFIFMLVGLQCALWSYVQRTERVPQQGEVQAAGRRNRCPAAS